MNTKKWLVGLRTVCFWLSLWIAGLSFILLAFAVACLGTGDQTTVRHIIVLGITFLTSTAACVRFWVLPAIRLAAKANQRIKELAKY